MMKSVLAIALVALLNLPEPAAALGVRCFPVAARQAGSGWEIVDGEVWVAVPPDKVKPGSEPRFIACYVGDQLFSFSPAQ